MNGQERQIEFYQTEKGKQPCREWLDKLKDLRGKETILVRIRRLGLGHFGVSKALKSGLFELKIDFGPGYRVYFARHEDLFILLCGGSKNNQREDIKLAHIYWEDYKHRHGK